MQDTEAPLLTTSSQLLNFDGSVWFCPGRNFLAAVSSLIFVKVAQTNTAGVTFLYEALNNFHNCCIRMCAFHKPGKHIGLIESFIYLLAFRQACCRHWSVDWHRLLLLLGAKHKASNNFRRYKGSWTDSRMTNWCIYPKAIPTGIHNSATTN